MVSLKPLFSLLKPIRCAPHHLVSGFILLKYYFRRCIVWVNMRPLATARSSPILIYLLPCSLPSLKIIPKLTRRVACRDYPFVVA